MSIEYQAFQYSGLESFTAPPSLRHIDDAVFFNCKKLRNVTLNSGLEDIKPLCFWGSGVTSLKLPKKIKLSLATLGVDYQNIKVLNLPESLYSVGES